MYMGDASDELALPLGVSALGVPVRAVLTVAMAVTLIFGLLPAPLLRLAANALPL